MNETAVFLVVVTHEVPNRWSRPFFARATSLAEAYKHVIDKNVTMFQHPQVRLEGYVLGYTELPDIKRIAKAWWTLAYQNAAEPNCCVEDFETLWNEHGGDPEDV